MEKLPLAKLNRDELYTFIVGLFSALAWYLYLLASGMITQPTAAVDPAVLFAWLFSTGVVYILYWSLGSWVVSPICRRAIKNQNDREELEKVNLTKNLSFFWAGPLEEQTLLSHIFGLITVSFIFVYHPILSLFLSVKPTSSWLIAFHTGYTVVTIVAYLLLSKTTHYLHQVAHFLDQGYCDTLDQTTYIRERAVLYAKVQHENYLAELRNLLAPAGNAGNQTP